MSGRNRKRGRGKIGKERNNENGKVEQQNVAFGATERERGMLYKK